MHTLSTLFPAAFPALALSHFVALLSPGPDFFLLVGYAVRYRIRGSIGLCLGIAAGNALYIVLAIVGWGLLRQAPLLFLLIELLGAGYLLWVGSLYPSPEPGRRGIRRRRRPPRRSYPPPSPDYRPLSGSCAHRPPGKRRPSPPA